MAKDDGEEDDAQLRNADDRSDSPDDADSRQPHLEALRAPPPLPAYFLDPERTPVRAVARIEVPSLEEPGRMTLGTGVLIAPRLVLTCQHVLPTDEDVRRATFDFNYSSGQMATWGAKQRYQADPEGLVWRSAHWDCLVLELEAVAEQHTFPIALGESLPLEVGAWINVLHHPQGLEKGFSRGQLYAVSEGEVTYLLPTFAGSSGAPVCSEQSETWAMVALHQGSQSGGQSGLKVGIPLRTILGDLPPPVQARVQTAQAAARAPRRPGQVVDYLTTPDDQDKKVTAALHQYLQAHPDAAELRPPHDLPARAPGFVGREADLQVLAAGLRQGQAMAVVGMGGLGKSSLAAEATHILAAEPAAFPGGITWVRCDDRTGLEGITWIEDQLLAAWSASLSAEVMARAASPQDGLELRERALRERLRPEGVAQSAPALVLLDNVERELPLSRLLDTVTPLGITSLLTSRVEPSSPRLRLLRLEVLAPEAGVQLFAERFAARDGNRSAEHDEAATRAIVEALGGLPLAIELAAARAARSRLLLAAFADELRAPDVLARLSDPLDPSASVRYSLGKTLRTLTPPQRVRFAALGLPEGPDWALPLIERMLDAVPASPAETAVGDREGDRAQTLPPAPAPADLEALIAYSLVSLLAPRETGVADTPRVRLHPLVRELAREEWAHLPGPEQEAALGGLLAGVRAWLARHQSLSPSALETLAPDEELIAGAVREAVTRHIELPQVIAIAEAWGDDLYVRNLPLDREMAGLQLESAREIGDRRAEVAALRRLAREVGLAGQHDERTAYLQAALAIARDVGDQLAMLGLLCLLGEIAALRGLREEAERMYEEASAIVREMGDRLTDWGALGNLGNLARAMGRFEEAERWYQRALESVRAAGDIPSEAVTETELGFLYEQMGDTAAAQRLYEDLLARGRAYGAWWGIGMVLNALGQLALRAGDLEMAAHDLSEALPYLEQSGAPPMVVQVRGNLAILVGLEAQRRSDREAAAQAFAEALRLFDQNGSAQAGVVATDQRPFVRYLLAELREQPAVGAPAPASEPSPTAEPAAAASPAPRARRWWPWRR